MEGLSLDDLVDMILSLDGGADMPAEALAERLDEPLSQVKRALCEIRNQGLSISAVQRVRIALATT